MSVCWLKRRSGWIELFRGVGQAVIVASLVARIIGIERQGATGRVQCQFVVEVTGVAVGPTLAVVARQVAQQLLALGYGNGILGINVGAGGVATKEQAQRLAAR